MTQNQPPRLQTQWADRAAGWLLVVLVGFLWLLVIAFAFVFLRLAANPTEFFVLGLFALVICLLCLLALILTGKVHEALAVYEFTLQGVSKRSPFWEQRTNWSEVVGWALSESDGIWWLLNKEGRVALSLEWHTLPEEKVPVAKEFVVDHLGRYFLAMPTAAQPLLSRLRRFHHLRLCAVPLILASFIGFWLAQKVGEDFIAVMAGAVLVMGILLAGIVTLSVFSQAKFLVAGNWLIQTDSMVTIHLPSVRHLERASDGVFLVGADRQMIFVSSHLTALWGYLRTRLPLELKE